MCYTVQPHLPPACRLTARADSAGPPVAPEMPDGNPSPSQREISVATIVRHLGNAPSEPRRVAITLSLGWSLLSAGCCE